MYKEYISHCISLARNYNCGELENTILSMQLRIQGEKLTIGIVGNEFTVPILLRGLFPKLEVGRISRSFRLDVEWGEETECFQLWPEGGESRISQEKLRDALLEDPFLEGEDSTYHAPFCGRMTVTEESLKELRLILIASAHDFDDFVWEELLPELDLCCVALSASKLLSKTERELARDRLNDKKPMYLLTGMEQVQKADQKKILEVLHTFTKEAQTEVLDSPEKFSGLWETWRAMLPALPEAKMARIRSVCAYAGLKLAQVLEEQKKLLQMDGQEVARLVGNLSRAYQDLPDRKGKTMRYSHRYLEELKTSINTELVHFNAEFRQCLKEGIEEESDIRQLQEALSGFVAGSWEEFWKETCEPKLRNQADKMDQSIRDHIYHQLDSLLKQYLTAEEYQELELILRGGYNVATSAGIYYSGVMLDQMPEERKAFFRLLPGCFFVAGGVALLSSLFLPGLALLLAGWDMRGKLSAEQKEQLYANGVAMSDQCLTKLQEQIENGFKTIDQDMRKTVEEHYDLVMNQLVNILERYKAGDESSRERIAQIGTELAFLNSNPEQTKWPD